MRTALNPVLHRTRRRRAEVAAAALFVVSHCLGCAAPARGQNWYSGMLVAPGSVTLQPSGQMTPVEAVGQDTFRDDLISGGHTINHVGPAEADGERSHFNFFFTDRSYRILYREKDQELLSGTFGTVYAQAIYYYDQRYHCQPTHFEVKAGAGRAGVEFPSIAQAAVVPVGTTLNAVSLIRVVHTPPTITIFSVTYSPDGVLRVFHIDVSREGAGVSNSRDSAVLREWFGIPPSFPVAEYTARPSAFWPESNFPEEITVVNLHYAQNHVVKQDSYTGRTSKGSKVLTYRTTPQDLSLASIDQRRGFGEWTPAIWP